MSYELTPENERFVKEAIGTGQFCDTSAVVNEALRMFQHRERQLAKLRAEIQEGIESGPGIPAEVVFAELEERARQLADQGRTR